MPAANGAAEGAEAPPQKTARTGPRNPGFATEDGKDHFQGKDVFSPKPRSAVAEEKVSKTVAIAQDAMEHYTHRPETDKPFVGAQPKFLRKPEIATPTQAARATKVVSKALEQQIAAASKVLVVFGQDSQYSDVTRKLLKDSSDEAASAEGAATTVCMAKDWLMTLPFLEQPAEHGPDAGHLLIYVGTPGKYCAMCIRSSKGFFDKAFAENRLAVLCKGACLMPLGTQEENIFGADCEQVLDHIGDCLRKKGQIAWGHGAGTKAGYLQKAFGYAAASQVDPALDLGGDDAGDMLHFCYLVKYIKFVNAVKLAKPDLRVVNYYDTGLLVSVLMGSIVDSGPSLLVDRDGLAMLRDASIGHIISKLNQVMAVKSLAEEKAVYNFFIGDGACRLNGGTELAFHLMEGYKPQSMITLFIFNNHKWAIEDNLVADEEKEHHLFNKDFYELIAEHGRVALCSNALELRETVDYLSKKTKGYLEGTEKPGLQLVIIRGLDVELPPVLGDLDPIRKSPEMAFMRSALAAFASDCKRAVPIYGCSAFEYIQHLHMFLEEMPEAKRFQYVCGRTDIQAAHMCGFEQPEGKCVLFINDVYGINSLGESLRMVLSGFGGKQLLVLIWHPTLAKVIDNFHLHRPPLAWPSLGPELAKYYVRSESDGFFVDFEGDSSAVVTAQVTEAIGKKTPLIVVNMLPQQECSYLQVDVRIKAFM